MARKQKVIRTHGNQGDEYSTYSLQDALEKGWIVVMANPINLRDGETKYIEYILEKDE